MGGKTIHLQSTVGRSYLWCLPVLLLTGVWLSQVFSYGGALPRQWLPAGLIVAALALVLFALGAFPAISSRLSLAVVGAFTAYCFWMTASALWAPSNGSVWMEVGRAAMYLLVFVTALSLFEERGGREGLRYGLAAGVSVLVVACVWRLATVTNFEALFIEDRLAYPVGYPNNAAALFLTPWWPLLWMAADPKERWYVRSPALGLCTALLMLAFLTQSRGAFWAFALSAVVIFIFSSVRLRTLAYLAIPLTLTAVSVPSLNQFWALGPDTVGNGPILFRLIPGVVAAVAVGALIAVLENRVRIEGRARVWAGALAIAAFVGVAAVGITTSGGGLHSSLAAIEAQWHSFVNDMRGLSPDETADPTEPDSGPSRLLIPGSSGRWDLWRVAWLDFEANPVAGVGAGNYVYTYNRYRLRDRYGRDAHSLPLKALAETGIVGTFLLFGSLGLALGGILAPRIAGAGRFLRRLRRRAPPGGGAKPDSAPDYETAWIMALTTAVFYWLLHSGVDWLWEMPAVTIPALLCLALALSLARARVMAQKEAAAQHVRKRTTAILRWTVTGLAALTFAGLAMPYLAFKYDDMAVANAAAAPLKAIQQARLAATLAPASPEPLLTQEQIFRAAAGAPSPGGRQDNLALALDAAVRAVDRDPTNWLTLLRAAGAAGRLAEEMALSAGEPPAAPGAGSGSLASTPASQAIAERYRSLTAAELRGLALKFATRAHTWNPKAPETADLLMLLRVAQ